MLMEGEKAKNEESGMVLGQLDMVSSENKMLPEIIYALENWLEGKFKSVTSQGWLEYLYGVVHAKRKNEEYAIKWLIRSVNLFPWHWGAWLELSGLIASLEQLNQIQQQLSPSIMAFAFSVYTRQALYQATASLYQEVEQLEGIFPNSSFLKSQRALLHYHNKNLPMAEAIFSDIMMSDPRRIESLDSYSNVLHVMNLKPKLALLAQLTSATDRFRPETCCVIGNYYSRISEHEKAVLQFQRALVLDRNFAFAWTLLGHEYIELRNTHAAIEAYRRAVALNRKDCRAWYSLGHTYESLEIYNFALYYYRRAANLRPGDPDMWQAIGTCLSKMGKPIKAIKALKRSLAVGVYSDSSASADTTRANTRATTNESEIWFQIAQLYEQANDRLEAVASMDVCLLAWQERLEDVQEDTGASKTIEDAIRSARLLLAKWLFEGGELERAYQLALQVGPGGIEGEDAKSILQS